MKAVLASIRPRHTANIKARKKSLEVRKTKPNIPTPFKVYVYETKDGGEGAGAVVCEFVCDYIFDIYTQWMAHDELPGGPIETWLEWDDAPEEYVTTKDIEAATCLTWEQIEQYMGAASEIYCWHISELKVYDVPRGLEKFAPHCRFMTDDMLSCDHRKVACNCQHFDHNPWPDCSLNAVICKRRMKRPPQSWCYVEEALK